MPWQTTRSKAQSAPVALCRALSFACAEPVIEGPAVIWFTARHGVHLMDESARTKLESWKEIANYLKTSVRTVQRWEKDELLPVHRHAHARQDTVYAYSDEIDHWRSDRDRHGTSDTSFSSEIASLQRELARPIFHAASHLAVASRAIPASRRGTSDTAGKPRGGSGGRCPHGVPDG